MHVGDEETLIVFVQWMLELSVLLFLVQESHLLMVWRSKHVFVLSLPGQLRREDLTLNLVVWPYIRNGQGNSLMHHFSIEVLSLDFLLIFSGHQFDWIRVREVAECPMRFLLLLKVRLHFTNDRVVYDNC